MRKIKIWSLLTNIAKLIIAKQQHVVFISNVTFHLIPNKNIKVKIMYFGGMLTMEYGIAFVRQFYPSSQESKIFYNLNTTLFFATSFFKNNSIFLKTIAENNRGIYNNSMDNPALHSTVWVYSFHCSFIRICACFTQNRNIVLAVIKYVLWNVTSDVSPLCWQYFSTMSGTWSSDKQSCEYTWNILHSSNKKLKHSLHVHKTYKH